MLRWNLFGNSLRDLAHAFSSIFFCSEHVTLTHIKSDFTLVLFYEPCDHFIGFTAKCLSDRIIKHGNQVTVLRKPFIDAFDIEFVEKSAVCESGSVDKHDLIKVAHLARARLHSQVIEKSWEELFLCFLVV